MTPLAPHLTAFFEQHLLLERRRSEQTRDSYAYAFKLLLTYASERLKVAPSQFALEQLDAPLVRDFLNALETTRRNGPSSRNTRLAAIKSFMHFVEYRVPSALEQIRVCWPSRLKKTDSRLVRHLSVEELQSIIDAPSPSKPDGIRDRAMLHLCFAAALRVSESLDLRVDDLALQPQASVLIHGKGRRRAMPATMERTRRRIEGLAGARSWGTARVPELFLKARGRIHHARRIRVHSRQARQDCESTDARRWPGSEYLPHVIRHTSALTILQATKDLRKVSLWLGHAHLHTTEIYTRADPSVKLEAIGIGDRPAKTALRTIQGDRSTDRVADVAAPYAESNTLPLTE